MNFSASQPRRCPLFLVLGLATAIALSFALAFGSVSIELLPAISDWWNLPEDQWSTGTHVLSLRLPRATLTWFAGGALAVSGTVLQSVLRNGLATPFTLGIASAGSFGAFLWLAFPALGVTWFGMPLFTPRTGALLFAILGLALVLSISRRSRHPDGLLLAGVTLSFLFGAAMMLVRHLADPFRLSSMDHWIMGSLEVVSFKAALAPLPWILIGGFLIVKNIFAMDQLALDEEMAEARGVAVGTVKKQLLLGAGLLTAAVVAQTGPIGFVGLLIPHALRPFTGNAHRRLLPAAWLLGGAFLLFADLAARTVQLSGRHSELPVGILTALIGGPLFLRLLFRKS